MEGRLVKHGFENWVPMGLFAALLLVGGCGAPPEEEPIVIEEPGGVGSFCYSDNDCTTSEICMVAECVDSICGIKQAPGGTTCDDGDVYHRGYLFCQGMYGTGKPL